MSLTSLEPCADELILYIYIYIKSAFIIHIGQNAFVPKKKSHMCTLPKSSDSYFSLYVQTNKGDKKRN